MTTNKCSSRAREESVVEKTEEERPVVRFNENVRLPIAEKRPDSAYFRKRHVKDRCKKMFDAAKKKKMYLGGVSDEDVEMIYGLEFLANPTQARRSASAKMRYAKEIKRLFDRDVFLRASSIPHGHKQFPWAQRFLASEMEKLGRRIRRVPSQGTRSQTPDFVRIYFDQETNSLHQRRGDDAHWNRLLGWVYA